jgi:hypothetical protein
MYNQGAYTSTHISQAQSYHPMSPKHHHSTDYPPAAAGGAGSYNSMPTKRYEKKYPDTSHKHHSEDHGDAYSGRWHGESEHEPIYRNGYKPTYRDAYGDEDNDWPEGGNTFGLPNLKPC